VQQVTCPRCSTVCEGNGSSLCDFKSQILIPSIPGPGLQLVVGPQRKEEYLPPLAMYFPLRDMARVSIGCLWLRSVPVFLYRPEGDDTFRGGCSETTIGWEAIILSTCTGQTLIFLSTGWDAWTFQLSTSDQCLTCAIARRRSETLSLIVRTHNSLLALQKRCDLPCR
jgi:hypothetical protein